MSVRELHNILVSDPNCGDLKYARDEDDNIIISDSTLRSVFPPQLKQMSACYKVMCGCECCISDKIIHSSLLSWRDRYSKNSNIKSKMIKSEGLMKKHITYMKHIKIIVMPHGRHIYAKAYGMAKATMCKYPQSDHTLPHWKYVLRCCNDCPCINISDQETTKNMKKQHPQLGFTFITSLDVVLLMVKFH